MLVDDGDELFHYDVNVHIIIWNILIYLNWN